MKSRFFLIGLLAAVIGYFLYIYEGPKGIKVGDVAPDFSLPTRNGVISLHETKGRIVLLNFWATWCPPCVHEMPSLEGLKQRLEGKDFQILAISVDEGGWPAIDGFLKKVPLTMTILLDAQGDVSSLYGTYQLPESYLIDRNGRILKKYVGPRDWLDSGLLREVEGYVHGP